MEKQRKKPTIVAAHVNPTNKMYRHLDAIRKPLKFSKTYGFA